MQLFHSVNTVLYIPTESRRQRLECAISTAALRPGSISNEFHYTIQIKALHTLPQTRHITVQFSIAYAMCEGKFDGEHR